MIPEVALTDLAGRLSRVSAELLGLAEETLRLAESLARAEAERARLERYLTPARVADLLAVSEQMVRDLVHAGELEAVRIGRNLCIPESAVQQFCDRNRVRPARVVQMR